MKKIILAIVALSMTMSMTACSSDSGISQEQYDRVVSQRDALRDKVVELEASAGKETKESLLDEPKSETEPKKTGEFDAETVLSQLEVKTYGYSSRAWNYAFLTIKNNSEYNLSIEANVKFYNESGELVGAKSGSQEAIESGFDTVLYFMPDEKYAKMEYELNVSEEKYYECIQSDLSYKSTEAKNKIILSVTNNGEEAAEFVKAYVLFFNGENVVGFSNNYVTDDDSELKAGKTIDKEMDCYDDFDSFKVYFTGRR